MNPTRVLSTLLVIAALAACSSGTSTSPAGDGDVIRHRSDVTAVTRVEDAQPGVFIPPFLDCRAPIAGDTTTSADGKVCTHVSITGATEPGKSFPAYASCDVVRAQRPYYPGKPANAPTPNDPRLNDAPFMAELAWAKSQIAATGCTCCHDSKVASRGASQWDISAEPIWLDTISDSGLALFAGLADSSVLGAYAAADNHGFDRTTVGVPTTDPNRMLTFVQAELKRRGISETVSRAVPPFGGPIYEASVRPPTTCAGEGIDPAGRIVFKGDKARYVYVLEVGSKNPGVPPNLDRPQGALWRLDVLPSANAIVSGIAYGRTPEGTYQDTPVEGPAPALVKGRSYQLTVLRDVGLVSTNCTFVYGDPLPAPATPPTTTTTPTDAGSQPQDGGPADAFGTVCTTTSASCTGKANYCAAMPGSTNGYCTATGCKADPSVCPVGWGCLDLSNFQAGAPSICTKP